MTDTSTPRRFTGRHMAAILVAFFAVVIAVNVTMARFAMSTFGGTVVENSYVASQKFNGWLAQGRTQKAMGWNVAARADAASLTISADGPLGAPLSGLKVIATLEHPLGAERSRDIALSEVAPGRYAAPHGLAAGQWLAEVRLSRGGEHFYLADRLVIPG